MLLMITRPVIFHYIVSWVVCFILSILIILIISNNEVRAENTEYQLKATYLYNFTIFVRWPVVVTISKQPFHICILGKDPFQDILQRKISGKSVENRELRIRQIAQIDQNSDCQILFISTSEKAKLAEIFASVHGKPILTVGESSNFAESGGMIEFAISNNKIRLRINQQRLEEAQLKADANLMRVATIVVEK